MGAMQFKVQSDNPSKCFVCAKKQTNKKQNLYLK